MLRHNRYFVLLNIILLLIIFIYIVMHSKKCATFQGNDVSDTQLGEGLILKDHNGKARSLSDFSGKAIVVFFGFTRCSDICPNALSKLSKAVDNLRKEKLDQEVQVLFVSIDTARDNPELLKDYVTAFNPGFLGLFGSTEEIKKNASLFKVHYEEKMKDDKEEEYDIDHTSIFYLFDRQGKVRVLLDSNSSVEDLVHDIKILLSYSRK